MSVFESSIKNHRYDPIKINPIIKYGIKIYIKGNDWDLISRVRPAINICEIIIRRMTTLKLSNFDPKTIIYLSDRKTKSIENVEKRVINNSDPFVRISNSVRM
ncbi:MAG TPA: hypothetical protein VF870_15805 [Ignavibacteriaceae bacterium]